VRFGGLFLKIETAALEAAKLESISLRHWSSRYSDCLLAQIFQAAACNARHTIAQRTAKWLLAVSERTQAHVLDLTQEELSQFLGVSRTYVTSTLKMLSAGGLIATRRGGVEILDEAALQEVSCACATAVRAHFEAVMSDVYPAA
jgi:CRP-like cAMP-binding protein